MKYCKTCDTHKNLNEFKNENAIKCKSCKKIRQYQSNLKNRIYLTKEINKLKDLPCKDCNIKYEPFLMDYDHLSNKIMSISKMVHETFSLENIKKEIAKCELVCILCHRQRTHDRLQSIGRKPQYKCYDRNRAIIYKAKNIECAICNIKYDHWKMEFDHIEHKNYAISRIMACSKRVLEHEISLCQVLCSMCHRRKTKETLWDK